MTLCHYGTKPRPTGRYQVYAIEKSVLWCHGNGEWGLFDTHAKPWALVGHDGGEPEDQLLVRDWQWVPVVMNSLNDEIERLRKELAWERAAGRLADDEIIRLREELEDLERRGS
jgi:hypothetical protein